MAPRRIPPRADVGCGYTLEYTGGNSVRIRPTANFSRCNVVFGLGDAVFSIDPNNPPDVIRAVINGDSDGSFAPLISYGDVRRKVKFDGYSLETKTFTDANGNTHSIEIPIISGYEEIYKAGTTSPLGVRERYVGEGRILQW